VHILGLDNVLWATGMVGELLLLAILFWRRQYRIFPVFFALAFTLAGTDFFLLSVVATHHPITSLLYLRAYYASASVEYLLEIAVLVEIAANVIRPARRLLPGSVLFMFLGIILVVGIAAFIMAAHFNAHSHIHQRVFVIADTAIAILRLAIFLFIAAFSQVLGLGWKNHVLQLASGMAFYAVFFLIGALMKSRLQADPGYMRQYVYYSWLQLIGYLCALYYWCWSFARQEAPRKEFSPQMTHFLVSIYGTARRQKAALARSHDK